MGILALWDLIKDQDHSISTAKLAEDFYKQHGRPLRIAVDEAGWRFNNLTPQQVFVIREKSNQPYQGIEKAIFYRLCHLLSLNVHLMFVFDGPRRPAKRGRNGGSKIDYDQLRVLKELLRYFKVPYHEAPGEAEAECARLQALGVVDAVWSQDSDTLMFGCDFLIRDDRVAKYKDVNSRSKDNTKKGYESVRVVRGEDIRRHHTLDRDALVLFAMLTGGDYDMTGLRGCGASTALKIVKSGIGTLLRSAETQKDCGIWRETLVFQLQNAPRAGMINVPMNYPDIKTLHKYSRPTVSPDEQLLNLRCLKSGWNKPLDELQLLEVTSQRFNIWGKFYMNWVAPVLFTRYLVSRDPALPPENIHNVKIVRPRGKNKEEQTDETKLQQKVTFSPFSVSSLQRKDFEGGERNGYWTGTVGQPFDPDHRVQWEFPIYLLRKVLPRDVLEPSAPPPKTPAGAGKRRKATDDNQEAGQSSTASNKRQKLVESLAAINRDLGKQRAAQTSHQAAKQKIPSNTYSSPIPGRPQTFQTQNPSYSSPASRLASFSIPDYDSLELLPDDDDDDDDYAINFADIEEAYLQSMESKAFIKDPNFIYDDRSFFDTGFPSPPSMRDSTGSNNTHSFRAPVAQQESQHRTPTIHRANASGASTAGSSSVPDLAELRAKRLQHLSRGAPPKPQAGRDCVNLTGDSTSQSSGQSSRQSGDRSIPGPRKEKEIEVIDLTDL
ncbi:PIN domain-like protein [Aaosphaeria arxii CBS 175.79]|uniref:PIN domain-like protein n=1 Tax=Aaosphaeria arxii CBS 175.79 TaxID=1450172 RepID=A0A6A5XEM0_9PLEO|nr:PIN domain-like protein [Aaosphaeria arxii CBS 175.79]KAF2011286.1 PIN domain-like protein [Aaosphaeria arxii CBS 175.79]